MRLRLSTIPLCALMLSACVAGPAPEIATPAPNLPDEFLYQPDAREQANIAALLPTEDDGFRALSVTALEGAPSLAEALARVEAARAGAARSSAERLPNIGADTSIEFRRSNPSQFGSNVPTAIQFDRKQIGYSANLNARWDADIFGALKANERAALARLDAATSGAEAVRIALLSEIAASVIDWRTLDAREAALHEDFLSAGELSELAGKREAAGLAPGFDRVRAEAAAATSQSRLAALKNERAQLIGRLVTLTGQSANAVNAALGQEASALELSAPPAALPSELLVRRPDVRRAEAELAASDADLAATARKRFPKLTLSGLLGLLAFNFSDLFDNESSIYNLGASIAVPLLDFGRIEAEIDGAAANKRAAFAAYRGVVFAALGDAETAYGLVASADQEAVATGLEAAALNHAAKLADQRYRAGLADFLTVLEARRTADSSGERAAASLGRARRARVLLWQALGGDAYPTNLSTSQ